MKHFTPIYLSAALIGTAAVWWIAPRFASEEDPDEVPAENAPVAAPEPADTPGDEGAASKKPSDDLLEPPSFLGIYVAKKNEPSTWGIIIKETPFYTGKGENQGTVKGGELFRFTKTITSSKGEMAVCQFVNRKEDAETAYLVKKADALLFTGDYTKLHSTQLAALQRYYLLRGQVAAKREVILLNAAEKNPYFREYQRLYKAYTVLAEEAKKLEERQNATTGMEREKAMEALRVLKVKEAPISKEYAEIRKKYNDWKAANIDIEKLTNKNIDIMRWRAEMNELRGTIPGLAL